MTEVIRIPNIGKYTYEMDNGDFDEIIQVVFGLQYTYEIDNGDLVLTSRKQYITEDELRNTVFTKSCVKECIIRNNNGDYIPINKKSYRAILIAIWKYTPQEKREKHSRFNFSEDKLNGEKGYRWCHEIHMSFQDKDANNTLKEIINMVKVNNLTIDLTIELETKEIIHFKYNNFKLKIH